jgi:polysaccharide deacetylase family protein (PEP-CTERM system associated)
MRHIFTVDVEDWYHGFAPSIGIPARYPKRLPYGMNPLLDLLDEFNVKATFFWLTSHALEYPELLKETIRRGHEIGSHGNDHLPLSQLSVGEIKREIRTSVLTLEDKSGIKVECFRAPYFSITKKQWWIFDILCENGISYDSSILPMNHWRTGISGYRHEIHTIMTGNGQVVEVPITTRSFRGFHFPTSGGGYFRIYPYQLTKKNLTHQAMISQPAVFYIHPWEIDTSQPKITNIHPSYILHYLGMNSVHNKLRRMLHDHSFGPLMQIANRYTTHYQEPIP